MVCANNSATYGYPKLSLNEHLVIQFIELQEKNDCDFIQMWDLPLNEHFESIINSPLSSRECPNYDKTKRKATGEETPESKLLDSLKNK